MFFGAVGLAAADDGKIDHLQGVKQLILQNRHRDAEKVLRKLRHKAAQQRHNKKAGKLASDEEQIHIPPEEFDSLQGLIDLQLERYGEAIANFQRVLQVRPNRIALYIYLGQSHFALQQYTQALAALEKGKKAGVKLPGFYVLYGRTLMALKRLEDAFVVFEQGLMSFPRHADLLREKAMVLIRLELFDAASSVGKRYCDAAPASMGSYPYLVVGEAFRKAGRLERAIQWLEKTALRFPVDEQVAVQLAYAYALAEQPRISARLFERTTWLTGRYQFEAADQYRIAGDYRAALRLNAQLDNSPRKLAQRFAIYAAAGAHQQACHLADKVMSQGKPSSSVAYLASFSCLHAGRVAEAQKYQRRIHSEAHRRSQADLQEAINQCVHNALACP